MNTPATAAIGRKFISGRARASARNMLTPKTTRDITVSPPASRFSLLRVVEAALGEAPNTPTAMLATPWPNSSRPL